MTDVTRQTLSDDTGTKTDGTVIDAAFVDQIYDQIDDLASDLYDVRHLPKVV